MTGSFKADLKFKDGPKLKGNINLDNGTEIPIRVVELGLWRM